MKFILFRSKRKWLGNSLDRSLARSPDRLKSCSARLICCNRKLTFGNFPHALTIGQRQTVEYFLFICCTIPPTSYKQGVIPQCCAALRRYPLEFPSEFKCKVIMKCTLFECTLSEVLFALVISKYAWHQHYLSVFIVLALYYYLMQRSHINCGGYTGFSNAFNWTDDDAEEKNTRQE